MTLSVSSPARYTAPVVGHRDHCCIYDISRVRPIIRYRGCQATRPLGFRPRGYSIMNIGSRLAESVVNPSLLCVLSVFAVCFRL
jgi:hypothetical protein